MKRVVKTGNKHSNSKYIIINFEQKICRLIPVSADKDLSKLKNKVKSKLNDYKIEIYNFLSLEEEINFLWPQIVNEVREKYPSHAAWLERSDIEVAGENLSIGLETKMAFKNASSVKFKNFLQNRLNYFLDKEIKIQFHNGDFLADISEENIVNNKNNYQDPKKESLSQKEKKDNNINNTNNNKDKTKNVKILYGKKIAKNLTHNLSEIQSKKRKVIIKGEIFDLEKRQTRRGKTFYIISLTDKSDSLTAKLFLNKGETLRGSIETGEWIKIRGQVKYDTYNNELTLMVNDMMKIYPDKRSDNFSDKRCELHLHTQMSAMDSVVNIDEVIKRAGEWGHEAIAITDHGVVQGFPEAYEAGQKYDVKIIYGMEAYMVDDGEPIIINPGDDKIEETTYVVFDLETTGLNPGVDEIIEIGAVKVKNGEEIERFSSLIRPQNNISGEITDLTGITNEMVEKSPVIEEILPDFLNFIEDSILVAHNAEFDYSFIKNAAHKTDHKLEDLTVLDTLALSRALLTDQKNHKLSTLVEHFNIKLDNHHRAEDDASATAKILLELLKKVKSKDIVNLNGINQLTGQISWKELPTHHTTILARNKKGLKDLYKLVSESHLNYFYRKPRILKSKLIQCRDNLLIGSACEAGQLFRAILKQKSDKEIKEIASFYDYLEIQPLDNNQFMVPHKIESKDRLKEINRKIYNLGKKLNIPVVATGDVHFLDSEDKIFREILQTGQKYDDADKQPPLYYRTTDEMMEEFSYFDEQIAREVVIENTKNINEKIDSIKPMPDGLFTPKIEGSEEKIREMSYQRAKEIYGTDLPSMVEERLEKELEAIIKNGYSVIYLISHKLVKKSLEDGYLVGSRGSVGSSLVATMCEITEVNPLPPHYYCPECNFYNFEPEYDGDIGIDLPDKRCPKCGTKLVKEGFDIPFEVFMGFEGDKVPDIDLNFSGEYQNKIHRETENLFGKDYVYRAGTISTIADRTAFGFVRGYMDDKGLNLRKAEVDRLVKGCTGVRRTTGQHPGGLMVVPKNKDIHDFTPVQHPANDQETEVETTHFDYHSISGRILKLDLLGHDDPTSIRMLQDDTGVKPESIPLDDPDTMSIFSSTESLDVSPDEIGVEVGTLGIPEFGTSFVRQMLVETMPTTFAELVRISGLSHGTDVWLNNARDLIKDNTAKLSEVISVRDDIMNYLLEKGVKPSSAFWIMEHVRKGRGLTDKEEKIMKEAGVPDWYINSCKKIKYMFPKAHAAAYVMMAYRIAYFKVHYPQAFYRTFFTIKAGDFDARMVARGYEYLKEKRKKLENKGNEKTAKERGTLTVLQIVLEAMARGIEFTKVELYNSNSYSFKISDNGLLPPLISLQGLGTSAAENIVTARKNGDFKSVEDLVNRTGITKTVVEVLKEHGCISDLPEKNQLSLF